MLKIHANLAKSNIFAFRALYEDLHKELKNKIKLYLLYLASELISYLISFKLVMVLNLAHVDLSCPGSSWPGSTPFAEFL